MEGRFEERWVLVEEEPPAWEDDRELSVAGTRVARLTGPRRVSGAARYVSDVSLPPCFRCIVRALPARPRDDRAGRRRGARRAGRARGHHGRRRERQAGPPAALFKERAHLITTRRWRRSRAKGRGVCSCRRSRHLAPPLQLSSASSSIRRRRSPSSGCKEGSVEERETNVYRPESLAETDVIIEAEYDTSARKGAAYALEPHCARSRGGSATEAARARLPRRASGTRGGGSRAPSISTATAACVTYCEDSWAAASA